MNAAIEAARFFLAASVAVFHWNGALPSAYLAVDLFFIVSGLVIGGRYEAGLRAGGSMAAFARGRAVRLAPLYLLAVLAGLAGAVIVPMVTPDWSVSLPGLAWRAALLVPVLDEGARPVGIQAFPLDVPAWSLWCEVLANALFAALCRLPRWAMAAPALLGLAALLATAMSGAELGGGGDGRTVVTGLGRIGFGFFAGVLLSRLPRPRALRGWVAWLGLAFVGAALLVCFRLTGTGPDSAPVILAEMVALFPALTLGIACCALAGPAARWCIAAGGTSYALYILHWPLYRVIRGVAARSGLDPDALDRALPSAAVLLALLAASALATHAYDRPLRQWLRPRRSPGMRGHPLAPVAAEGFEPPTKGL